MNATRSSQSGAAVGALGAADFGVPRSRQGEPALKGRLLAAVVAVLFVVAPATAEAQHTRDVSYTDRGVVEVNTRVRFTTMIVLPDNEEILDYVCGDSDYWVISGAQNLAYVKPAKAGATTNLNLVTAGGRVYSFVLTEGSGQPDLKLYVKPDDAFQASLAAPVKFYSAAQVEELRWALDDGRRQLSEARQAVAAARDETSAARRAAEVNADDRIAAFRATLPLQLQFPYVFRANQKPFHVSAIYHDDRFTYIRAEAKELPALYEVIDGKPNLINFQVDRGVYVVPKILDSGYLAIGKSKFPFARRP